MNKVLLIGNLTRDPELSETPSGVAVCKFGLAVGRRFANANGEKETDFFNITVWRGLAENCAKFLKKGNKAAIAGSIQMRQYEGQDGIKRTAVDVIAQDVEFLTPKAQGEASDPPAPKKAKRVEDLEPVEDDGDLPF